MFLTKDSTSPSYVLVSSSQHVTEKQALAKVIGKVVVTQTQSSTFGSVLVPHCYIPSAAHEIRPLFTVHVKPVLLWLRRRLEAIYLFDVRSTTKHVEGKAIGKVVELSASSFSPLAFPHCQIPIAIYRPVSDESMRISKPVFVMFLL